MLGLKLIKYECFLPLEVVGRGSETQLQEGKMFFILFRALRGNHINEVRGEVNHQPAFNGTFNGISMVRSPHKKVIKRGILMKPSRRNIL